VGAGAVALTWACGSSPTAETVGAGVPVAGGVLLPGEPAAEEPEPPPQPDSNRATAASPGTSENKRRDNRFTDAGARGRAKMGSLQSAELAALSGLA